MATIVEEYIRNNARNGTVIDINDVDNQLVITLNGTLLTDLRGPRGETDRYNANITSQLRDGEKEDNVLVLSLMNFAGQGFNPAGMNGSVSIGAERINLNQAAPESVEEGLYYQAVFVLHY